MKRDWDVIRQVLIEVEELSSTDRDSFVYGVGPEHPDEDSNKAEHALLLWKAGFISAIDAGTVDGSAAILSPELTWEGHDLLETMRSNTVWERIKSTAKDKGIELTFDAVKALAKPALDWIIQN